MFPTALDLLRQNRLVVIFSLYLSHTKSNVVNLLGFFAMIWTGRFQAHE